MNPRLAVIAALVVALALAFTGSAVAEAPHVNTPASITGTAAVGEQLTANNGTWLYFDGTSCGSECTMTYQWQRCSGGCSDISGATGRFYTVQAADAGHTLRAMETVGKHDCGEWNYSTGTRECRDVSMSAPSGQTSVVPGAAPGAPTPPARPAPPAALAPAPTSAPRVSGEAMVDETLTASRGLWTGSEPLTVALEWLRCDASGASCEGLGIGADSYTVLGADVGKTIRVRVTGANGAGARTVLSDPTVVVSELRPTERKTWIPAAKVQSPHRLVVDQFAARPTRLARRGIVRVTLRVSDDRGFRVQGALVTAVVLPGTALVAPAEVTTGEDGLVTLVFTPGSKLSFKKRATITLVVTARRPGDRFTSPRAAVARVKVAVVAAPARKR